VPFENYKCRPDVGETSRLKSGKPSQISKDLVENTSNRIDRLEILHSDSIDDKKSHQSSVVEHDNSIANSVKTSRQISHESDSVLSQQEVNSSRKSQSSIKDDLEVHEEADSSADSGSETENPAHASAVKKAECQIKGQSEWVCEMCKFDNFFDESECRICGAEKNDQ